VAVATGRSRQAQNGLAKKIVGPRKENGLSLKNLSIECHKNNERWLSENLAVID
jgi:hypothetical protein